MIRLDKQTNQKEQICELIGNTLDDQDLELECLINNSPNKKKSSILHENFISILKRFKGHPDYEDKQSSKLNITFGNASKYKGTRIAIKGIGAINSYCNNENLNIIRNSVDFEVKERARTRLYQVIIPNYNMRFNLKSEHNFNNNEARIKDILRDIATEPKQYRLKKTFSFIKKAGDYSIDLSIVKSSNVEDKYLTVKEVREQNLFNDVVKPANIKTQFMVWWKSIENSPNEKVLVRNFNNSYTNIKDSNVFNNSPTYEVEIEYIRNKTAAKPKFKNITERKSYIDLEFANYFKQIGLILQCVNNSFFILNNDEKYDVKIKMIKVIENSITESTIARPNTEQFASRKKKQSKTQSGGGAGDTGDVSDTGEYQQNNSDSENEHTTRIDSQTYIDDSQTGELDHNNDLIQEARGFTHDEHIQQDNEPTYGNMVMANANKEDSKMEKSRMEINEKVQKGGVQNKLAEIKKNIKDSLYMNGVFFGPNIVDLTYSPIAKLEPSALPDISNNINIQINYVVTDKTDGDRNLLFIDSKGLVYGIERSNNIKYMGLKLPALANSIFDGEFVNRNESGKLINNYYIFDCYIYCGENIMNKPFNWNRQTGRHYYINTAAKYINSGVDIIQDNDKMPLYIFKKEYYPSNTVKTFSELDANEKPLIFENCYKILSKMNHKYGGFLEEGHLFTYKTDGLVFLPNNLGIFQKFEGQYIENTFKQGAWVLNYKWKPADHLTIDFKIQFQKDLDNKSIKYTYLNSNKYVKLNLISKVYHNSSYSNQLDYWLLNCGIALNNIPEDFIFFSQNPFIGSFDDEGDLTNNMGIACFRVDKNDNIICKNGDIITDGIICECSYDISNPDLEYRWTPERIRPDKTNPNAYFGTATTAWELINKPITKEFLSGMQYNTIEGEGDSQPQSLRDIIYYTSSDNKNDDKILLTRPLNKFNNFVKEYVINRALSGYIKPKVLDLACGRLGELYKYVAAGVDTLVGIDINADNIYNYKDGAATRLMNARKENPAINKLANKTILLVGDAVKNIHTGEAISDNLNKYFLDVIYGNAKGRTPKLKKLEGCAVDHFDLVVCMYAFHYMLESQDSLDNFLRNVSENLLDQGYFIGTCLDGGAILKEMRGRDELIGTIDDKVVYFIRKKDGIDYKNITLGNKITTFYETFSGYFDENLVNMSYIKERAIEHNLKLIEYKPFLEEPISLLTQFESKRPQFVKTIRNTDALMTWARMNYYFIFQKVRDANE